MKLCLLWRTSCWPFDSIGYPIKSASVCISAGTWWLCLQYRSLRDEEEEEEEEVEEEAERAEVKTSGTKEVPVSWLLH